MGDAAATANLAAAVGDVLPSILGRDGPRRYLLLVQQPAEARGSGGLPGNWGEIVADGGHLELVASGRISDLDDRMSPAGQRAVEAGPGHRALYGYTFQDQLWQNTTLDPDFTVAADIARQLWDQTGGSPLDGVLSVDPQAVAAVLTLVGSLDLSDGTVLGPDNAAEFLLHGQYLTLGDDADANSARVDRLGEAVDRAWARLTTGDLPGPRVIATTFGPVVEGRHLSFASFDEDEGVVLERLGLAGSVPRPERDGVGVVTFNLGQNKIDYFLERVTSYRARWDPLTGSVSGTYTVQLSNAAPAVGLPAPIIDYGGPVATDPGLAPGENFLQAYLYTALPPVAVRVDGELVMRQGGIDDRGWEVTVVAIRVPPGGSVIIEVDVSGAIAPDGAWTLDVVRQPAVNGDRLSAELEVVGGAAGLAVDGLEPGEGGTLRVERGLDGPIRVGVSAR
ncbi:MAG: DUF4012 domain-containing protein [Acidimicrobiia bacterium]|nr:DUF4012 domain-containing protein [Acidimicrobiia bacterium]